MKAFIDHFALPPNLKAQALDFKTDTNYLSRNGRKTHAPCGDD